MTAVVVGGGICGLAAAAVLGQQMPVTLVDRGRRLGGRMGTTKLTEGPWRGHVVDLGAAYITARDPRFAQVLNDWETRGLVRRWTDTFLVADDGALVGQSTGPVRYAAADGLRTLPEDLAAGLGRNVTIVNPAVASRMQLSDSGFTVETQGRFSASRHRYAADSVVLALPGPQAISLLAQSDPSSMPNVTAAAIGQSYQPIITVVAQWPERAWQPFSGCFVNDDPRLSFVADDGDRRGDGAAVLVAHSSHTLAQRHLGDPAGAVEQVVTAVRELFDIAVPPVHVLTRRWSLARPLPAPTVKPDFAFDMIGIGLAGDAFSENPRVEASWISGTDVASHMVSATAAP